MTLGLGANVSRKGKRGGTRPVGVLIATYNYIVTATHYNFWNSTSVIAIATSTSIVIAIAIVKKNLTASKRI